MQTTQQLISERNRQIRVLMQLFKCTYATASQLYYVIRNYDDTQVVINADGSYYAK